MKKREHNSFIAVVVGALLLSVITSSLTTVAVLNLKSDFIFSEWAKASQKKIEEVVGKQVSVNTNPSATVSIDSENKSLEAVKNVKSGVVSILIKKDVSAQNEKYSLDDLFDMSPFHFFFNNKPKTPTQDDPNTDTEDKKTVIGGGTGFFITADGLILTNKHVVEDKDADYVVVTEDGTEYDAEIKATDPFFDLAILKVDGENFKALTLGDSDKMQIGQTVLAIGNALAEFGGTVTKGVISAKERSTLASGGGSVEKLEGVLQTDASINPGNSGGPLVNLNGEVIGINTAVASSAQGIGFAIPINDAKTAVKTYEDRGKIIRPQLGLRYRMIIESLAEKNKLSVDHGALVIRGDNPDELAVIPGGPADKAGIEENDIILEVNGEEVNDNNSLTRLIQKNGVDDKITLKIIHDGEEKEVTVTLEEADL